ncbi:type II secretion system protein GspL [Aliivibrio fischeri]|uniref:Type II secretion system protein L n=1 Tax=Aliivibrio fischeri TaxID=668 RepID=A0A6N3Z0F8_ALIFS|nr:type II secretion system protein GspL [Aliivibrio fischeri]MUK80930.1 type II secretion system protein GspL [Aliivibrio fischeri]MUK86251.1 type II secretion system protein GspL [Aliivibrio fischeri]
MSEHLIIRLNSQPSDPIQWIVWSPENKEVIASGELDSSEELPSLSSYSEQRMVSVLLPSSDVLLREVVIPEGAARQFSSMLPFIIEDDLAQDVDDLHMVILKKDSKVAQVAIVEHNKMTMWLEQLNDAGIQTKRFMPDVLALPLHDDGVSMVQLGQQWLIRDHEYQGAVAEPQWVSMLLTGIVERAETKYEDSESDEDAESTPMPFILHSYSECGMEVAGAKVNLESPELVMQLLAEGLLSSKVNVLSGQYRPQSSWRKHWRVWQKVILSLGLVMVAFVAQHVSEVQKLEQHSLALHAESERIFRDIFPNKRKIPTASYLKSQMKNEEARLQGGAGGHDLLAWMAEISPYLSKVPQVKLQSLKFDGKRNEIRLQASASDFPYFEKLTSELGTKFEVEQGQLNKNDGQVFGAIIIRRQ